MKCQHCTKNYKDCEWYIDEECWYEPNDYDGKDIGTATIIELDYQNMPSNKEISISLPKEIWERIASACISVADYNIINDEIKEDLRKTYFEIKSYIK